jgi:flagellar protein FlbD
MIKLSRLGRHEIALNCDLIAFVEACPDTTVRMVGGESLIVHESVDEVLQRISAYRCGLLRDAGLSALLSPCIRPPAAAGAPGPEADDVPALDAVLSDAGVAP